MPFGFIQNVETSGSGTSLVITVPAMPVGSLAIINIKFGSTSISGVSVTDNAGTPNTYAKAVGPQTAGSNSLYQFYGVAVTGGATTITISWTGSASCRAAVDVFSGGMRTNATVFDKAVSATGTGTAAAVTLAPTTAGELIAAALEMTTGHTLTAGANYLFSNTNTSLATEYRQVGTTAETAPYSWSTSDTWAEVAGAYIPAPSNGNFLAVF